MIVVTGANGRLGRLVIDDLIARGVPAADIVAVVRSPPKAADLAVRGVLIREADYNHAQTLGPALTGADRILLISSSEVGQRIAQHRNVIDAAISVGPRLLAYTSILNADTSGITLAIEHKGTEELIRDSGLPYAMLRNGWYLENYTADLGTVLQQGAVFGSAGEGRVAAATRADFAAAAAAVLTGDGHENSVYELGGDEPFTMAGLAAEISRQSGTEVVYRDLSIEDYVTMLVAAGLPEPSAATVADADAGVARGDLTTDSGDLRRLIGRPTTSLAEAIGAALKEINRS